MKEWRMWGRKDWHNLGDPQFLGNKKKMTVKIADRGLGCELDEDTCEIEKGDPYVEIILRGDEGFTRFYCTRHSPIQVEVQ